MVAESSACQTSRKAYNKANYHSINFSMKFDGLFIGIDRYASPDVNWLGCAKRDAVALHALFADTFSEQPLLLVDERATKTEIISSLDALSKKVGEDDLVVIAFSG